MSSQIFIRNLDMQDYSHTWNAMRAFTDARTATTQDEIWILQHFPVFTQGQNGKPEHLLDAGNIPVIKTDRGGQITYHGPGQLILYPLIDLKRKQLTIRGFVSLLENAVVDFLANNNITARAKCDAPGVYVEDKKICSIGLRIRKGCSYHGLAFNIKMDLKPFSQINPCGFSTLSMTQLSEYSALTADIPAIGLELVNYLGDNLNDRITILG